MIINVMPQNSFFYATFDFFLSDPIFTEKDEKNESAR